jgi:formate hydrogenlyase transcriptional activator
VKRTFSANISRGFILRTKLPKASQNKSWLSTAPVQPYGPTSTLAERLHDQERKIIESALAESKGRIAGRFGAATKLRIPSSTLESKIRTLGIKKNHFRLDR